MNKVSSILRPAGKLALKGILLLITVCGIAALPSLIYDQSDWFEMKINYSPDRFFDAFLQTVSGLFSLVSTTMVTDLGKQVPLFDYLGDSYLYSMTILCVSVIIAVILAFFTTYLYIHLPAFIKKTITRTFVVLDAIPDIFVIMCVQYGIIFLYKSTGIKLFQLYNIQSKVYIAPIICLTTVPLFMLFKIMVTVFEEEFDKIYIHYARAKGMTRNQIFFNHAFRNILYSLTQYFSVIYWYMISSLILIEYIFQMKGYTLLLTRIENNAGFVVVVLLIIIPYGLLFFLIKIIASKWTTGRLLE